MSEPKEPDVVAHRVLLKLTLFESLPNPPLVKAEIGPNGKFVIHIPNSIVLSGEVRLRLQAHLETLRFDPHNPPKQALQLNVLNTCGDADCYDVPMRWLAAASEAAGVRVFNHPTEVFKTRRDTISRLLAPVPGLVVPACVRFRADSRETFAKTFEDNGFQFPVLVRPSGSQTGQDLLKINSDRDWAKIQTIAWFGKVFYMTQFVEFRNESGNYVKLRVCSCGPHFIVKHVKIGNNWKVHNATSDGDVALREAYLEKFSKDVELRRIVSEIKEIVHLDYWGIDLGYNGRYTLFEGNPAMTMLGNVASSAHAPVPVGDVPAAKVIRKEALANMLIKHALSPNSWLYYRTA